MPSSFLPAFSRHGRIVGVLVAVAYGLILRAIIDFHIWEGAITVMSVAYIVLVPAVVGYLAVRPDSAPSWPRTLFLPWPPVVAVTAVLALIGREGAICIIMALPILLVGASLGGIVAKLQKRRTTASALMVAALPFALGGIEGQVAAPYDVHTVDNVIDIAASPAVVWREIVSVREIQAAEMPGNPLFLHMGFPRPLSAEIDREAVGGIRKARFAGGLLFLETVTELQPERLLSFGIAAQTDQIPPGTLDDHVTIGGPYFDVLQGAYRIEPLTPGHVRLHLQSRLRVSTHFNWYATLWVDAVMASIQRNILAVEKVRAEHPAREGRQRPLIVDRGPRRDPVWTQRPPHAPVCTRS